MAENIIFGAIKVKKKTENSEEKLKELFYMTRDPITKEIL